MSVDLPSPEKVLSTYKDAYQALKEIETDTKVKAGEFKTSKLGTPITREESIKESLRKKFTDASEPIYDLYNRQMKIPEEDRLKWKKIVNSLDTTFRALYNDLNNDSSKKFFTQIDKTITAIEEIFWNSETLTKAQNDLKGLTRKTPEDQKKDCVRILNIISKEMRKINDFPSHIKNINKDIYNNIYQQLSDALNNLSKAIVAIDEQDTKTLKDQIGDAIKNIGTAIKGLKSKQEDK